MRTLWTMLAVVGVAAPVGAQSPAPPTGHYWVYVANESSDLVSLVRFGPEGAVEEKTVEVGVMPADIEGAHGIAVSPSGANWYVSLAHGTPYGAVWKYQTGTDAFVDSVRVGLFPATMALTPDGLTLFVANFNLHGQHRPSSVSALLTPFMTEAQRIETCVMPHGSRLSRDGRRHYSVCMMDDQLVEISTSTLAVARRLSLRPGAEGLLALEPTHQHHAGATMEPPQCKPTWVSVSPDDRHLYVPCNGRAEVLELDAATLAVTRRFATGKGPYNADVSPDGTTLAVTLKGAQAVALFDLATGREVRIPTTQPITHGVTISPDSRFAFVSNEAIGAIRGTVDVIDLAARARVASAPVQYQPGGIAFWKMAP